MIITAEQFKPDYLDQFPIQKKKRGNPGTNSKTRYKSVTCAFDIETTNLDDIRQSVMYIWQFQIGEDLTVIGRTWDEFQHFLNQCRDQLKKNEWLCIYVHNLSFEFSFLKGIYDFKPEEVFAIEARKVLKCSMYDHFEFRCSYMHSNMNLRAFLKKYNAKHQKLEMDYNEKRYPWTQLSQEVLDYSVNDVIGLVEALNNEMAADGDNLYSIPLTSTGYVRRDCKRAMRTIKRSYIQRQLPDVSLYTALREAFRGGNTHGNRFYAGDILHDVKSEDESSAYPFQLTCRRFPITGFFYEGAVPIERIVQLISIRQKAVLMRIRFAGVHLINKYWGCPYLSRDKCRDIINGVYDNGRILSADYLETTLTDIDLKIVLQEYAFDDCNAYDVWSARYGRLPQAFIDTVNHYYHIKTEYKGIKELEYQYTRAKAKLNALYGMCAQDPVKRDIVYNGLNFEVSHDKTVEAILAESNKKAFLPYSWGVWCTALARYSLEEGIRLAGDQFVYCDTDSIKYVGDLDFSQINDQRKQMAIKNNAYATDPEGITHYMGVFEEDGIYKQFITLGAKKYADVEQDGSLHITCAGVNKIEGAKELAEHGGLKAFKEGMVFKKAGGTEAVYNDDPEVKSYTVDGHVLKITSNCYIGDSTYTLGLTEEYRRLLSDCFRIKYAEYDIHF